MASTGVLIYVYAKYSAEQTTVKTLSIKKSITTVALVTFGNIQKAVIAKEHITTEMPLLPVILID